MTVLFVLLYDIALVLYKPVWLPVIRIFAEVRLDTFMVVDHDRTMGALGWTYTALRDGANEERAGVCALVCWTIVAVTIHNTKSIVHNWR